MDNQLFQLLLSRAQQPQEPQPAPATPPNIPAKMPPEATRWINAQKIQQAVRNNWTPNPMVLRAALGHR